MLYNDFCVQQMGNLHCLIKLFNIVNICCLSEIESLLEANDFRNFCSCVIAWKKAVTPPLLGKYINMAVFKTVVFSFDMLELMQILRL